MKDANGTEITVGSIVKALHQPDGIAGISSKDDKRGHNFFGTSKVILVLTAAVLVEKTNPKHNPVHVPELLVVVQ